MPKKLSRKKKVIVALLTSGVIVFGTATAILGDMVYDATVGTVNKHFQDTDIDYVYRDMPEVIEAYEGYESQDLTIVSRNHYGVEAKMVFANEPSEKTVVIVHGIGMNMWRHLREALMYLDNGFNVVLYNQRYTGATGGDNRSFGYHEKNDLASVMEHISNAYPTHVLGAHGFSMGAGTVGMYAGMDEAQINADFLILDCPYDTMKGAIEVGIAAEGLPIPTAYAVWAGDVYNRIRSGFSYSDVNLPLEVAKSTMPMYVIHAEEDKVCLVEMGQAIYDAKVDGYKEIWIEPETEHVAVFDAYPDKYEENVMAFIEKALAY